MDWFESWFNINYFACVKGMQMDPDRCMSDLYRSLVGGRWDESVENAQNLRDWLTKGGFTPKISYDHLIILLGCVIDAIKYRKSEKEI